MKIFLVDVRCLPHYASPSGPVQKECSLPDYYSSNSFNSTPRDFTISNSHVNFVRSFFKLLFTFSTFTLMLASLLSFDENGSTFIHLMISSSFSFFMIKCFCLKLSYSAGPISFCEELIEQVVLM